MPNRRNVLTAALAAPALLATAGAPAYAETGSALRSTVDGWREYLTTFRGFPEVAIGVFDRRGQYSAGGDRIFQIGSATKTFTSLALAIADRGGRLSLGDPLRKHLDPRFPVPAKGARPITLEHLATQTSGLDRLPPGLLEDPEIDLTDPYAKVTEAKLITWLGKTTLLSDPGTKYLYSNYGTGLLGMALGPDYDELIRTQIAEPLRLKDTTVTLSERQLRRKVQGYDAATGPTPDWRIPVFPGFGALYGTVDDLLRYLRAHVGDAPTSMRPALELVQRPRFTVTPHMKIGLAWNTVKLPASGRTAIWHNGATGGFSSFIAFCPSRGTGVAILANLGAQNLDVPGTAILDSLD